MVGESRTIQILDPRPEDGPEARSLSGQLTGVGGEVIGRLEDRKYHADSFLQELQTILEKDYGAKKVVYARKFTFSAPCSDETIDSLIEECDAVVHGIAD